MTSKSDPLELGGLDPATIAKAIDEKKSKAKVPTELEQKKEARLALKEARMSAPLLLHSRPERDRCIQLLRPRKS